MARGPGLAPPPLRLPLLLLVLAAVTGTRPRRTTARVPPTR
uniref:Truncated TACSTD2 n=1 Tax=Homo sapiens TaxID=9606 RepID=A0A142IK85_HUMAN|nr:truncated TACSTD2 [Homo sapiens]